MVLTGWRLSVTTTTSAAKVAGLKAARAAGSATARPRVRQPGANRGRDAGMSRVLKLIRAIVKREPEAASTNNAHHGLPAYLLVSPRQKSGDRHHSNG